MTGFFARLLVRAAGAEAGLEPRPRHRFADRPAPVAEPDAVPAPLIEEDAAADRAMVPSVVPGALPPEAGIERDRRARLPPAETLPAAGVESPFAGRLEPRSTATRLQSLIPAASGPRDPQPSAQPDRAGDGDRLLMPLIVTAAAAGERSVGGSPALASGSRYDDGTSDDDLTGGPGEHNGIRRFGLDAPLRERRFAAESAKPGPAGRGPSAAEVPPTVFIRIGRIDVRTVPAAASPAPTAAPKSRVQKPSLDAYLRARERRRG